MWRRKGVALVIEVRKLDSACENLNSEKPRVVRPRERKDEIELVLTPCGHDLVASRVNTIRRLEGVSRLTTGRRIMRRSVS